MMSPDKSAVFLLPIVSLITYICAVDVNSFSFPSTVDHMKKKYAFLMNHFIYSDLPSWQFQNLDSAMI